MLSKENLSNLLGLSINKDAELLSPVTMDTLTKYPHTQSSGNIVGNGVELL